VNDQTRWSNFTNYNAGTNAVKYQGCFPFGVSCHSQYPETGVRQGVLSASKKKGFVSIVSALALNAATITS
jgi:hypothetical protein